MKGRRKIIVLMLELVKIVKLDKNVQKMPLFHPNLDKNGFFSIIQNYSLISKLFDYSFLFVRLQNFDEYSYSSQPLIGKFK